jgi:hypothetical protein
MDAAAQELCPVIRFRHVGFGAKQMPRFYYRLFEWQMLEGVQCVVMYENSYGALLGKQVRRACKPLPQFLRARLRGLKVLTQSASSSDCLSSITTVSQPFETAIVRLRRQFDRGPMFEDTFNFGGGRTCY